MTNSFTLKLTGAAVALALSALTGTANAGVPGYVADTQNQIWTSPYGLCWRTTDWTPDKAAAPCDAVRRVEAPVPPPVAVVAPPVAVAPPPPPAPTPLVVAPPPPPPPVIEQISLSSDVLFEFNKAELRPAGQQKLDEIADRLKGANVQQVAAIGHADRIGSDKYNKELSEKRATSVKDYLAQKGVDQSKVRSEGRGEAEPVTGNQCKGSSANQKLIACLQPDRRVDIEVRGERQVAGTPPAPSGSAGATSGASSSTSGASAKPGSMSGSGSTSGSSANPSSPSSTGAMGNAPSAPGSSSATPGVAK